MCDGCFCSRKVMLLNGIKSELRLASRLQASLAKL